MYSSACVMQWTSGTMALKGVLSTEVLLEAGIRKADSLACPPKWCLTWQWVTLISTTVSPTFCLGCATEIFTEPLRIAGANHIISTVDRFSTMVNSLNILKWNRWCILSKGRLKFWNFPSTGCYVVGRSVAEVAQIPGFPMVPSLLYQPHPMSCDDS